MATEEELTERIREARLRIERATHAFERIDARQVWVDLLVERENVRNLSPTDGLDPGNQGTLL